MTWQRMKDVLYLLWLNWRRPRNRPVQTSGSGRWPFHLRLWVGMMVVQYLLLLITPADVLNRFAEVRWLVGLAKSICGRMPLTKEPDNTIVYLARVADNPQPAQVFASILIFMFPLYVYACYRWLGFDKQHNYRHFVISPFNRGRFNNIDFVKDALPEDEQRRLGMLREQKEQKPRLLFGIAIWSVLLGVLLFCFLHPLAGFGSFVRSGVGGGAGAWLRNALVEQAGRDALGNAFAILSAQCLIGFSALVTAAFICCWRDWFVFIYQKIKGAGLFT